MRHFLSVQKLLKKNKEDIGGIVARDIIFDQKIAAPLGDPSELKKYLAIHFESLGSFAIYDPDSELDSRVSSCSVFGVKNIFVHIESGLFNQLQQLEDKSIALKFKKLMMEAKSATMRDEQGVKILRAKYVQLPNGDFVPCFELKPVGKYGNKRLLGCMKTVEIDGASHRVIVFKVYVPDVHQGKKLDEGLMQLQKKVNQLYQVSVAASSKAVA